MRPSEIEYRPLRGYYRHQAPDGWVPLRDAAIVGDGYTFNFYRLTHRTKDRNCDDLNGWYSVWEDHYRCELKDDVGELAMNVDNVEKADKLHEIFSNIHPVEDDRGGIIPAAEFARDAMKQLVNYCRK